MPGPATQGEVTPTSEPTTSWIRVAQHFGGVALLVGIYLTSHYSYVLFHSLVELFSVVVAAGAFTIVWNARRYFRNSGVLLIGVALLPVAVVGVLHTLAYQGLSVFTGYDTNLATQLWIVGRYLLVAALLAAPLVLDRRGRPVVYLVCFCFLAGILTLMVFLRAFPTAYVTGSGLTPFKVASEYVMCGLLVLAQVLLTRRRQAFERRVSILLSAAIAATIASELLFTVYVSPFGPANLAGHLMELVAFFLIYKGVIEAALARPYSLLFRELKQSEETLRESEAQQRHIADVLQETLLTVPRQLPGVAFGHLYQPATVTGRVGGDFYDVFALPGGKVGLLIGDVSGHGLEAAALTSVSKNTIKAFALEERSPGAVLEKTNLVVIRTLHDSDATSRHFVTAFYGVLDPETGTLRYSSAGHPPAVIRRASGESALLDSPSPVVGVFEDARFQDKTEQLGPEDLLVLYTDGLTDARIENRFFGEQGLRAVLAERTDCAAPGLPSALHDEVVRYCGGTLRDDLAILAIQLSGRATAG
jgi:serine phosphatase RsbU (regulator of sigma subunit)